MTDNYVGAIDTVALLVQVGDGASPEVFTHPVLINTQRAVKFSAQAATNIIPDTSDPTKPAKTTRVVTSMDCQITGDGVMDQASVKTYVDWLASGAAKNIKVQVGSATGDELWTGPFVLTAFDLTGTKHGEVVTASITFEQADLGASTAHA